MDNEPLLRGGAFVGIFVAMALWEWGAPARGGAKRRGRWPVNLALGAVNGFGLRLVAPALALGAALDAEARGIGLCHWLSVSDAGAFALTLIALDFIIYLQHMLMHRVPLLWRMHRIHHTDPRLDVTTALRFHPLEILFSAGVKVGAVYALGAPVAAVVVFEAVLNAMAMFSHSDARMGARVERALRWIIVTPAMHRVHHSPLRADHDSNYGFNFSLWDRVLGTYRPRARDHRIGLPGRADDKTGSLPWLLWLPARPNHRPPRRADTKQKQNVA